MRTRIKPRFFRSFLTPKKKLSLPLSACNLRASSWLGGKGGAAWKTKYLTQKYTNNTRKRVV
jgi:hypothetical protein